VALRGERAHFLERESDVRHVVAPFGLRDRWWMTSATRATSRGRSIGCRWVDAWSRSSPQSFRAATALLALPAGGGQRVRCVGEAHALAHFLDGLARDLALPRAARLEDLRNALGVRLVPGAPLADRVEERVERLDELVLHLAVADGVTLVALLEVGDLLGVGVEGVVVVEHRVVLDDAGIVGL